MNDCKPNGSLSLLIGSREQRKNVIGHSLLIGSSEQRRNVIGDSLCWLIPVNREGTWLVTLFVDWFQWAEKERDWSLSLLIGSSEQRWNVIGHFLCWLVPTDREGTWLVSVNREKMCGPSRVPNPSGSWGRCCCCFSGLVRVNSLLDFSTSYSLYSTKDCSLLRCSGANWMPLKQTNKQTNNVNNNKGVAETAL